MRWVHSVLRSQAGVALVMALLTVVVLLLVGAGLVTAAMTEVFTAQVAEDSGRALNVAEAGLAHAIRVLRQDPDWSDDRGATEGCEGGSSYGKVLRDSSNCLQDVSYPGSGAIPVSPASSSADPQAECTSIPVEMASTEGGSPGSAPPVVGTYTVYFHTSAERSVNTLRVRVVGRVGRAQRGVEALLQRVTPGDFVAYSASTVDSTVRSGSGSMSIHGSVYIRGDWAFKGNAGQYNDRPITTEDASREPYENQTYVCGDLRMIGSAQIGEPTRPMKAVHVQGRGLDSTRIYANRKDKAVPDVRLGDVRRFILCVRGQEVVSSGTGQGVNEADCGREFGEGVWGSYTNELSGEGMTVIVLQDREFVQTAWRDMEFRAITNTFLLPKKDKVGQCMGAANANLDSEGRVKPGGSLQAVLNACVLYYEKASSRLYVAGGQRVENGETNQVIYVPGRVILDTTVTYVVDNAPDADTQSERDTATIVVACEGCSGGTNSLHVKRGAQILARNRGSSNRHFARTDLLAFLVNGITRLEGQGQGSRDCSDPSQQEQNAVFVTGGEPGEIYTKFRLQLFGALVARRLVLQDDEDGPGQSYNVRWCQVPDLGELVGPTLLGRFLNSPASSSVVIKEWREIGF